MEAKGKVISGFSKLSKSEKIEWIVQQFAQDPEAAMETLKRFWVADEAQQRILDGFSENTITNFPMPFGVAPNFIINGKPYIIPMVIEESSVVAAASSAAKYWMSRGGFHAKVIATKKLGQVHFSWTGSFEELNAAFPELRGQLLEEASALTANMEKRGGGVLNIELVDLSHLEKDYYQLKVSFETCDSMGANFINSVLESFGSTLEHFVVSQRLDGDLLVIMAILSNYTPECLVRAWVECPVDKLGLSPEDKDAPFFADKFCKAVRIARIDPFRAVTHNKGIFNGVDAVVLATANDFRAIEACGHAYASHDGQYRSLSYCTIEDGVFRFWIDLPLAVGTVGGLTKLHPLARLSLELLGNPNAEELMQIIAVTGLAQNFAAVRSLVTTGIQKGHMKMHLQNILNHLGASIQEKRQADQYFQKEVVSFNGVRDFLSHLRNSNGQLEQEHAGNLE